MELQQEGTNVVAAEEVRRQLEVVVEHPSVRSSKRSVQFLRYVVEQTLNGAADQIKERTIGVEIFGRSPTYDTNVDHIVRTAAIELRKRLTMYYGDAAHRKELKMTLVPGSYVPRFSWPEEPGTVPPPVETYDEPREKATEQAAGRSRRLRWGLAAAAAVCGCALLVAGVMYARHARPVSGERQFWAPLVQGDGPVLIAMGTARDGLPKAATGTDGELLVIPGPASPRYIPYADALTTAQVAGELRAMGKAVVIRRTVDTTIRDLRQMPAVLIGAFDNPWTLRLLEGRRFTLEVDQAANEVYIRDATSPAARGWGLKNEPLGTVAGTYGGPAVHDYALLSRIHDARTGRAVLLIAGLEPFGTQAAGDFVTNPASLDALSRQVKLDDAGNLQLVLETTVTDGSPGESRVVAVSRE